MRDAHASDYASLIGPTRAWDDLPVKNGEVARAALFGTGEIVGGLISQVHIGGLATYTTTINGQTVTVHENPYKNINKILDQLGIDASPVAAHQNHFHIFLSPPTRQRIDTTNLLQANVSAGGTAVSDVSAQTEAQGLFAYVQDIIDVGDVIMFTMDIPYVPVQETPITLVQAATSGSDGIAEQKPDYLLTACQETESAGDPNSAMRGIDPAGWLAIELGNRSNRDVLNDPAIMGAIKVTLLEDTVHGDLISKTSGSGRVYYMYNTEPGYTGEDEAVFMAEFEGKRYKIVVKLIVSIIVDENTQLCPPVNPSLIEFKSKPVPGSSGYDLNSVTITFAALGGSAIGETTGTTITLDDNAAGHGWFIDSTPWSNDEYLPTHDPNVWVAKDGSAAAGKMDMLSVLLHEYGHALGIDHSADHSSYMATTLTPGTRRMPSPEELAHLAELVGEMKQELVASTATTSDTSDNSPLPFPWLPLDSMLGLAFLGRLRNQLGSGSGESGSQDSETDYAIAANATLTNGAFTNDLAGWSTQGGVEAVNGTAVLREVSGSHTRLAQVFMRNEQDNYLTFTVSAAALDDHANGPDDAFEVALLDANTGASLAAALSLSRTDALLNRQASGAEYLSQGMLWSDNPDGSRTYIVDLTQVAVGTTVNLSFDLIGFATNGSEVAIRDVKMLASLNVAPVAVEDNLSTAEDQPFSFDVLANDQDEDGDALTATVVAGPTHGQLTQNADGRSGRSD